MFTAGSGFLRMFFVLLVGSLCGCLEDEVKIVNPPEDQVIKPDSELADLLQRIGLSDGSADNIIDQCSCISVILPLTVIVNGVEVPVNSAEDFDIIEDILDEFVNDDDTLDILFPVAVVLADHTQIIVSNKSALKELIDACVEGGYDDDIECVDFKYPLKVSLYNSGAQVADVITLADDEALYGFFIDLESDDLVNFIFPVTITLANGTEVVVSDNYTLRDFIKEAIDDCDEDDDNDHDDDDDLDDVAFVNVLTEGEWVITYFFEDGEDHTADYENFTFTFLADGTFTATYGVNTYQGEWETETDDDGLEFELDIDDPLDELDEDWKLIDFDNARIRLRDSSGGNTTFLTFERP